MLVRVLPLVRIVALLDHITGGVKAKNLPERDMDAESVRKTLKISILTATNAILMRLSTIMYLNQSVNLKARRVTNSVFRPNL